MVLFRLFQYRWLDVMTFDPWVNFQSYAVNRPPVVLFGLGLVACSLTLVVLAFYVKDVGHLQNPNVLVSVFFFLLVLFANLTGK